MKVFKNISPGLLAVILLGIFLSPSSFSQESAENDACIDILGLLYRVDVVKKRKDITQEWLESLNICEQRPTGQAPETLEINFGLNLESSPKDYETVAKVLKQAGKSDSGIMQVLLFAAGGVPAVVHSIQPTPPRGGDAEAQYLLGYIYYYGLSGKEGKKDAKKWLKRAALQGHSHAQILLDSFGGN